MKIKINQFPIGVQFSVFICIWISFMLVAALGQTAIIPSMLGIADLPSTEWFEQPKMILWSSLLQQILGFGLPALLFATIVHKPGLQFLGLSGNYRIMPMVFLIPLGLSLLFFVSAMGGLVQQIPLGSWADALQENRNGQLNAYLAKSSIPQLLLNILLLAVVPAVCEELFFRGAIMKFMLGFKLNPIVAFIGTSFFFTILHLSVYEFLPIFSASMILCMTYYFTNNLWSSMLVHFINNALQIIIQYVSGEAVGEETFNLPLQLFMFVGAGVLVWLLLKKMQQQRPVMSHMDFLEMDKGWAK